MNCSVCFIQYLSIVSWIWWQKGIFKKLISSARNFFSSFHEDHEMMHLRDLQKLEGVLSPSHLEEMHFTHSLRHSKVNIKICELCQYSYELLLPYLCKMRSTTILGIINEHINFQVSPGLPSSISDDPEAVTLTGSSQDAANQINQKEICWGASHLICLKILLKNPGRSQGFCFQILKR
ncbi:Transcription initiation factor TFIID subunit 5 [Quillaja saponaria]|uniref:Transcription initiation factor TFIID subunit 5 n=1 Tax=Quillaja saponaria TaxID=32244 RepID=A0AAD7LJK3_QUISA|nr:Transcription initiation factor TFIID subunit 5 [Quillaja saponaria]